MLDLWGADREAEKSRCRLVMGCSQYQHGVRKFDDIDVKDILKIYLLYPFLNKVVTEMYSILAVQLSNEVIQQFQHLFVLIAFLLNV